MVMRTRYNCRCSIPKKGKFGRVRTLHSWQSCFFFYQRDLYSKIICKHIAFLKENRQKHIKYKLKLFIIFIKPLNQPILFLIWSKENIFSSFLFIFSFNNQRKHSPWSRPNKFYKTYLAEAQR